LTALKRRTANPPAFRTVTVSPRGSGQVVVRTNAQRQMAPVEDPEAYQRFFAAPEKAMFLTAHQAN
jgi:hypothetical protein